jgi:hypothetical protein
MDQDKYPNATEYLRFVERSVPAPELGPNIGRTVRVLQQWWESAKMINPPPGEWRDVPLLPDDNTSPYA